MAPDSLHWTPREFWPARPVILFLQMSTLLDSVPMHSAHSATPAIHDWPSYLCAHWPFIRVTWMSNLSWIFPVNGFSSIIAVFCIHPKKAGYSVPARSEFLSCFWFVHVRFRFISGFYICESMAANFLFWCLYFFHSSFQTTCFNSSSAEVRIGYQSFILIVH